VILGACNPPLAYAAVVADAQVGLLLPCNVTVEAVGSQTSMVRLTDPEVLLRASAAAGSQGVARDRAGCPGTISTGGGGAQTGILMACCLTTAPS
jgi:hypothetical protein